MKVTVYEWKAEQTDRYGDIIDVDHNDSLKQLLAANDEMVDGAVVLNVCLVKSVATGPNERGLDTDEQAYAYIVDGLLEVNFDNGDKVPNKYIKEAAQ